MEVGAKLRQQRQQHQWTQAELAERLFVSMKTISNWENGRTVPDVEALLQLSKVYAISLDDLLTEGSDWVDDIKKKEQLAGVKKWALLSPLATNWLLTGMLYLPVVFKTFSMSDNMFYLLFLVICANAVSVFRMKKQLQGSLWYQRVLRISTTVILFGIAGILLLHKYLG
jgi:transcriptional regulator with XRE-family HTH domain